MTVSSEVSSVEYDGDGVTVAFEIPFQFFDNADVQVSSRDGAGDSGVISTGFSITGAGTVTRFCTFDTAPGITIHLVIERAPALLQQTDYVENDRFPAATNEDDQDRQVMIAQHLYRLHQRTLRFPAGDASVGGLAELPPVSVRKSKNFGFDSAGRPAVNLALASGTLSQDSIGGFMWPRNAQEVAGAQTPVANWPDGPILDMRRWMNNFNTGINISAGVAAALAAGYKKIWLPAGHNLIDNIAVTGDDVHFIGDGESSRLTVVNANSRLWNVTGQRFKVYGIKCEGDATSSSSTNGVAAYLNGAGAAVFEDVRFEGFGFGGISGVAATALKGPSIVRPTFRNTQAGGNEIYLGGLWVSTLIEKPDCYSSAADRCLLLYDNSTAGWQGLTVRGGGSRGYVKQQWGVTDENWDGSSRVWDVLFDGVNCNQSNWSAIKCKTSRGVRVTHCIFDQCGLAQEDQVSGLYGDVLVNSLGAVMIDHNEFRDSGSAAIRCNAPGVFQYPGANPNGQACALWNIDHNQIKNTGVVFAQGDGITLVNGFKNALMDGNHMRGITRYGVNAVQTAATVFWDLGLFNNTVTDSPAAAAAYNVGFGQSLRANGNLAQNCGATGWIVTDIQDVTIGRQDRVLDPAIGSGRGYQIGNVQNLDFEARAGNSTYDLWVALTLTTIGTKVYNGANVYEAVVAGTTGNAGGPTGTAAGVTDGTVTWAYVGKYQLMPYAVRLVGTQVKVRMDFDAEGCITGPIEGIVMGSGGVTITYKTSIQTTDATPTNTKLVPIPDLSAWMVEMKVLAQDATTPNRAMFHQNGLLYRAGAGTALEGAVVPVVSRLSGGAGAWTAVPAASANSIAVARVTGAAGKTINWNITATLFGMP